MTKYKSIKTVQILSDDTTTVNALNSLKDLFKEKEIIISDKTENKIYLGAKNTKSPQGEGYYINTAEKTMLLCSASDSGQFYSVQHLRALLNGHKVQIIEKKNHQLFRSEELWKAFTASHGRSRTSSLS